MIRTKVNYFLKTKKWTNMKSFSLNINFKINEFLYFLYINLKKKKKYKEIKLSFEWFKR